MVTYSWPANVAKKNKDVWFTSVVDWPPIITFGSSAQSSVLSASDELSKAVQQRIDKGSTIPLPSELKPGQIQIPIDEETSSNLELYLERIHDNDLKKLSEIERANREKRSNFLSEYRINLDTVERLRDHADQAAVAFAEIAIKSIFIMNGGALVAIPAILQLTKDGTVSKSGIAISICLFIIGVLLSSITNYLAYRSMFETADGHSKEIHARSIEVEDAYYPSNNVSENQTRIKSIRDGSQQQIARARKLADFGVFGFCLSVLFFILGIGYIIWDIQMR